MSRLGPDVVRVGESGLDRLRVRTNGNRHAAALSGRTVDLEFSTDRAHAIRDAPETEPMACDSRAVTRNRETDAPVRDHDLELLLIQRDAHGDCGYLSVLDDI